MTLSGNIDILSVEKVLNKQKNGVFLTKRRPGQHLEGLWEFPGGKVEKNESTVSALKRELLEEIAIDVTHCTFFYQKNYAYPEKNVALYFYIIDEFKGVAEPKEGQEIAEVAIKRLSSIEMPEANEDVVEQLNKGQI